MKRSNFIKKVLKNKNNTVFTTKGQVENAIEVFEKLGMFPPYVQDPYRDEGHIMFCEWEPENESDKEEN